MEEYALSMGLRLSASYVAAKDARTKSSREEYALSMVQRSNDVMLKDAQTNPNEEEYARDTVHTAI
jgi:hypothetical protein